MFAASKSGSADAKDANFKNVTMLLHGNGTNGAQNNTFVDSSTNNFSITRNGNTTQGTFSPYGSNWSNYFDGSGDYLTLPNATTLALGTSDFTVEGWFNFSSSSAAAPYYNFGLISCYENQSGSSGFTLAVSTSSNSLNVGIGDTNLLTTSFTISVGTWYHFAVSRSSGTIRLFVNGALATSASNSSNFTTSTNPTSIGSINVFGTGNTMLLNGYASNVRIVKGTAVYTSAFTPSTTPVTAVTNTALLTCQSNRFTDNSTNNFTITKNGDVSVQRFSPFNATSAYSTSVIGGSGYFDGSGDYLATPSNSAFDFGTGDFTVEFWVNTSISTLSAFVGSRTSDTSSTIRWCIYGETASGGIALGCDIWDTSNTRIAQLTFQSLLPVNAWTHCALVRSGTSFRLYQNGVQSTSSATSSAAVANNSTVVNIGSFVGSAIPNLNGYLSNLRIVKGTAVYTSSFTPPSAPLTAITNTSLLLSNTNAGILDNAMMNDLETVGNAQISTIVKKYGTGSMYFDGTGDWLNVPHNENLNMRTGDFTVECWVNRTATTSSPNSADVFYAKGTNLSCAINISTGKFQADHYGVVALLTSTTVVSNGTWYHFAVTRSGTTLRLFVNGSLEASMTYSADFSSTTNLYVGADPSNTNQRFYGYLDDLRVTKGFARYTASFTAPTAPFPDKG
jgi:hypothetical protein